MSVETANVEQREKVEGGVGVGVGVGVGAAEETRTVMDDCCICFESIGKTNNCTTPCGHSFCFQCIVRAMGRTNLCPICRTAISEKEEDVDDDEDDDDDDDDDEDYEYGEEDEEYSAVARSAILTEQLSHRGYTMLDMVALYMGRFDTESASYHARPFVKKFIKEFQEIVDDADKKAASEFNERTMFMGEDHRRHSNSRPRHLSILENGDDLDNIFQILYE